ncbi:tautomerase family protein [Rhizobium leucaenae]|uniref:Phenylpyruvate tautomerase PptA (4-oxalocrotonate tautomerase family) n=1 Tax=Rhizobium leucaenae TaxID=29450 RepID=A0A7W6ZPN0_9HYPH|nr:tautomerase family protein [Rhizobium leucaenae]MBB4566451.1 phenylpyruvate tautomerase PptA (4-oxalocrotonate tautomerase family) [Rhizobium leucaenae]MBB6301655.1 phenylpyruvate tautomerase PptA (4-oxalocrotonate tautomerase family) [Rhizobium leucaenae]
MPFTRISLLRGKSPEYLQALSDNFHRAMVETFDVPPTDRFQEIHQLEPNELIFDRTYLGGPRSDNYVFFQITIGKPRSTELKKAFYRRLVALLADAPGLRPEDVMINIVTTTREDWSFADGIAQMIEQA